MRRASSILLLLPVFLPDALAAEPDAPTLLAKARAEFLRNREQERRWVWTTTEKHSITDKHGNLLEELPTVKVESPIRPDGRRCNAVLSWGDGLEPYLIDASAEERCQVEQELPQIFKITALLDSTTARFRARKASAIAIEIQPDSSRLNSEDLSVRCAASIRATIEIDPSTFFPKVISGRVVEKGCDNNNLQPVSHYGEEPMRRASSSFRQGATFRYEYELQHDQLDTRANHFWVCMHRHASHPLLSGATVILYWGRRIPLTSTGGSRLQILDVTTVASRVGAESQLKFLGEERKD